MVECNIRKQPIKVDGWKILVIPITDWKQTKQRACKQSTDQFLKKKQMN